MRYLLGLSIASVIDVNRNSQLGLVDELDSGGPVGQLDLIGEV
jgi:hypothetical protein